MSRKADSNVKAKPSASTKYSSNYKTKSKKYSKNKEVYATQAISLDPEKKLGQHFLISESIVLQIVNLAHEYFFNQKMVGEETRIKSDGEIGSIKHLITEIGPGSGVLTLKFLQAGFNVTAIEKDIRAIEGLEQSLQVNYANSFKVIESDILNWQPIKDAAPSLLVGNLPYYITSDILLWYCANIPSFSQAIFMVQDEVAERLIASPCTKEFGRLSVRMQLFFNIEKKIFVPSNAFYPPPKVNSAVIVLTPREFAFKSVADDVSFNQFTILLFSARRKMLRRVLKEKFGELLQQNPEFKEEGFWQAAKLLGVLPETRPDQITPANILQLHYLLQSVIKPK